MYEHKTNRFCKKEYDDVLRFISYFYQISLIKELNPGSILEIGVGNKTVSNYLKQQGFNVITCDIDRTLKPDYSADIRELPFDDNSFDAILACEILEHLPWKDVDIALTELHRVTKDYVVISIPYSAAYFEFLLKFSLLKKILNRDYLSVFSNSLLFY